MKDQVIQHSGRGHSELGPSSSERWLKCTPSAVLSAQFQDKPSVYAEEGTFLHELCELKLHSYLGDMTRDVIERQYAEHRDNDFYSDEAEEVTDVYVNHCIEVIEAIRLSCPDPYIAVEHRLDFSEYVPDGFGTGDFIAIADGVIEVIDFKGGRGVRVNADHNSQLMLYGLGALLEFDPLYDIKTVRMTIVQPRLQNISSFEMNADELIKWADEYLHPRALRAQNEEAKQENANKNPVINSTQRDYMAGEVSRDLTERLLLPEDIVKAHEEGLIHFHDMDYYAQHMHNCDLVNLEDMLQNGTVITGTLIEKPHSFSTACNIATQIIAQVASNQYGGQSISLAHLAPFVQVSREKIRRELDAELTEVGVAMDEKAREKMVERRLREEVKRGVQTIQYQVVTLLTTNGQAPFVTVYMYLGEAKNDQERNDLALVIEEVLRQRYEGVKNEQGVWVTPAFPKLIYVLEEENIHKDSRYFYLTELAAKCTAKRMVPDYISEKIMRQLKGGDVYTCIDYSIYGTPLETTTYRFAKCLQKRFGVIDGITDKGYITNSYHIHVTEPINAFDKIAIESRFQALSPGGAISYVEVPNMTGNLEAVLQVMRFIYDNILYAELNTKSDYCQVCGWDGEIEIWEDDGKLVWVCPRCGNRDQNKMNVARRTCGYIGTQFWNQGRTQEIKERVLHL